MLVFLIASVLGETVLHAICVSNDVETMLYLRAVFTINLNASVVCGPFKGSGWDLPMFSDLDNTVSCTIDLPQEDIEIQYGSTDAELMEELTSSAGERFRQSVKSMHYSKFQYFEIVLILFMLLGVFLICMCSFLCRCGENHRLLAEDAATLNDKNFHAGSGKEKVEKRKHHSTASRERKVEGKRRRHTLAGMYNRKMAAVRKGCSDEAQVTREPANNCRYYPAEKHERPPPKSIIQSLQRKARRQRRQSKHVHGMMKAGEPVAKQNVNSVSMLLKASQLVRQPRAVDARKGHQLPRTQTASFNPSPQNVDHTVDYPYAQVFKQPEKQNVIDRTDRISPPLSVKILKL